MSSQDTKNPNGGVIMGHVMESPDPDECLQLFKRANGVHLLPDYGPVCSVKRPVRTRTRVADPVLAGVLWGLGG